MTDRYGLVLGASLVTARDIHEMLTEEYAKADATVRPGLERAVRVAGIATEALTSMLTEHSGPEAVATVDKVLAE